MNAIILVAIGAKVAVTPLPLQTKASDFAIVHARIEIGNGDVIEDGTVYVKDGKIAAVGSTVSLAEGIKTIDAKGKVLYPGFIDAFTTNNVRSASEPRTDGKPDQSVTAPASLWIGTRKGISPELKAETNLDLDPDDDQFTSGITTVAAFPARGSLRGTGAVVNLLPAKDKTRVVKPGIGMGMSFRNGPGSGYPSDVLGVNALLRQTLHDAKSLVQGAQLYPATDKKPFWMASIEALTPVVTGQMPGYFDVTLEREILRSIRVSEDFGFKLVIAGGRDSYRVATTLAEKQVPVILNVDFGAEPSVTPDDSKTPVSSQTPVEVKQERLAKWKEQVQGVSTLQQAGIKIALTSGGTPKEFLENVRRLIKNGWAKGEALKSLTSRAANLLGVEKELVTIETGKVANLVLMSGEFDNDKTTVASVWVAGQPMYGNKEAKK
jgi:imidazolonepropionase-like amidohydrolase